MLKGQIEWCDCLSEFKCEVNTEVLTCIMVGSDTGLLPNVNSLASANCGGPETKYNTTLWYMGICLRYMFTVTEAGKV